MAKQIFIKTWFGDWLPVSRERALRFAKRFFNTIVMGNQEDKVTLTNKHIKGVEFTLEELQCHQ